MFKLKDPNLLIRLLLILILIANLLDIARALSDKRLCADINCREIISIGTGKINYRAGDEGMVSFKINSPIRIKSKSAGNNPSLWGVEVNGREGYAPKNYIRETKIFIKEKDLIEVDVLPKTSAPDLATSEKLVEQENTIEATTKPLNFTSADSTDIPLKSNSNEKLTAETLPEATPVIAEVVDGTEIPIFSSDIGVSAKNMPVENKSPNMGENTQKESQVLDSKVILSKKERVEDVYNESIQEINDAPASEKQQTSKKVIFENLSKQKKTVEKTDFVTQKDKNINDTNENQEFVQNASEEGNKQPSVDEHIINTNKKDVKIFQTDSVQTQNHTKNELVSENSEKNLPEKESTIENGKQIHAEKNLNDEELTKPASYNSEVGSEVYNENSKIVEVQQETLYTTNLSDTSSRTKISSYLENEINMSEKSISQQESQTEQSKKENPMKQFKTGKETELGSANTMSKKSDVSYYKERPVEEPTFAVHDTEPNENKQKIEVPDKLIQSDDKARTSTEVLEQVDNMERVVVPDKLNQSDDKATPIIKVLTQVDNMESVVEENDYPPTYNVDDQKSSKPEEPFNTEIVDSVKRATTNNIESIKPTEGTINSNLNTNSNSQNSNNQQEEQIEKVNEDNLLQQSYINKQIEIENVDNMYTDIYYEDSEESTSTSFTSDLSINEDILNTTQQMLAEVTSRKTISPTTYNTNNDIPPNTPLPTQNDILYQELVTTNVPPNNYESPQDEKSQVNSDLFAKQTTESYNSIPITPSETDSQPSQTPSFSTAPPLDDFEAKENKGLFATIMGAVNNVLSINKKNKQNNFDTDQELDEILFSKTNNLRNKLEKLNEETNFPYCKNIGPKGDCPETDENHESLTSHFEHISSKPLLGSDLTLNTFLEKLAFKILELSDLLAFLVVVAATSLFFLFGYYCFCNSSREGALLSKLNQLESSLLASHKENSILKHNLMSTRQKLTSIEDNSFGSNDMVVSLKKELEEELLEKNRLQEQVTVLQKELENAADAGIELNKIVSELLSNQTGDESIISSVEELQKQLNEQQNTIFEINASLAEKSRENSELQLLLAEQNARYETELANLQRDNDELEHEKGNLLTRLNEMKNDFDNDITAALEGKNLEIKRLQHEIVELTNKLENEHTRWQTSVAKIEALEECLKNVRRDPSVNITEVIDVANVKAQLIEIQKKYTSLRERFETELDSKKLAINQLESVSAEVEKLKQDFNQSEKDKLEAQTRLEVLSNYFKDKENQLQKELSLKEAMWLKQQGETTTTVDRLTAMQEEIQSLKSQNDSLRAEIEAQVAAHKAQTGTLENRAHETWLAARQSDRRYEEARAEASALRRKLTALAGGNINDTNKPSVGSAVLVEELTQAPSPIHMESPASPMLGRMPPPPFLPPPFMGPPPPFMNMPPPPPFVPPGEMRPAPLGRIMSPPLQRSGRFSPQHLDYEDYLDYDNNNTWQRHTYSPPPRTYRSLSPTDSRYNYGTERDLMSTYDTETDFSPPPSPRDSRRRGGNSSDRIDSNTKMSYGNSKKFNTSNKGQFSSGSEKSFNSPSYNDNKPKKGSAHYGGKSLV